MSRLLELLLLFLRPAVDDPPADDPPADDPPADDADDIVDEPPADDPPADETARLSAELETERAERRKEREARERFEREAAELRIRHAPAPRDDQLDENQRVLRDPNSTPEQKWTAQANIELASNRRIAQTSLATAADVNDRTAFASVMMSDPRAKKYETRVEEELQKVRSQGSNAAREAIYTFLLGKDMREGKYKKKAPPAADTKTVARGRTPGVRSDVSGKTTLTEREKRRQRLENVQI